MPWQYPNIVWATFAPTRTYPSFSLCLLLCDCALVWSTTCLLRVDWHSKIRSGPLWIHLGQNTQKMNVSHAHRLKFTCVFTHEIINHVSFEITLLKPCPTKYLSSSNLSAQTVTKPHSGSGEKGLFCQPSEYLVSKKQTKREMLKCLEYPWWSDFNVSLYNESFWKDHSSFSVSSRTVVASVLFKWGKVCKVFSIPTWNGIFNVGRICHVCMLK